jgi:hypothetical protein
MCSVVICNIIYNSSIHFTFVGYVDIRIHLVEDNNPISSVDDRVIYSPSSGACYRFPIANLTTSAPSLRLLFFIDALDVLYLGIGDVWPSENPRPPLRPPFCHLIIHVGRRVFRQTEVILKHSRVCKCKNNLCFNIFVILRRGLTLCYENILNARW